MVSWQLQEAKAKLSEVIQSAEKNGPQIITRRGVQSAVVLSMTQWNASKGLPRPVHDGLTEEQRSHRLLEILRSGPDFEIPDRHRERTARRNGRR